MGKEAPRHLKITNTSQFSKQENISF